MAAGLQRFAARCDEGVSPTSRALRDAVRHYLDHAHRWLMTRHVRQREEREAPEPRHAPPPWDSHRDCGRGRAGLYLWAGAGLAYMTVLL